MITRKSRETLLFEKEIVSVIAKEITEVKVSQPSHVHAEIYQSSADERHANADYELIFDENSINKDCTAGAALPAIKGAIGLDYFLTVNNSTGTAVSLALIGSNLVKARQINSVSDFIAKSAILRITNKTIMQTATNAIQHRRMTRFLATEREHFFCFSKTDLNDNIKLMPSIIQEDLKIQLGYIGSECVLVCGCAKNYMDD